MSSLLPHLQSHDTSKHRRGTRAHILRNPLRGRRTSALRTRTRRTGLRASASTHGGSCHAAHSTAHGRAPRIPIDSDIDHALHNSVLAVIVRLQVRGESSVPWGRGCEGLERTNVGDIGRDAVAGGGHELLELDGGGGGL